MTEEVIEAEVVEEARNLPAVVEHEAIVARAEITVDEMVAQKAKILDLMTRVMDEGKHYGKIPGVSKPTLLKPGAEAINVALRLAPDYESEKVWGPDDHLTVISKCVLRHIPTGLVIAAGEGLCTTRESKYAKRKAMRVCPECGEPQIRRSKFAPKPGHAEYVEGSTEPGWYCWAKEGGCGTNFRFDDERITNQEEGVIDNPDLPDTWNTVLKMADKRALVAAVLNGTAASDVFTQDVEDQGAAAQSEITNPQGQSEAARPQVRREGPEPYPIPSSWPNVLKAARACDNPEESEALYEAFLRAASYHLYGKASLKDLSPADRKVVFQKACGAVCWLHDTDAGREGPFSFFAEDQWRQAWAQVLDGHRLEIPDYVPPEPPAPAPDEEAERLAREAFAG